MEFDSMRYGKFIGKDCGLFFLWFVIYGCEFFDEFKYFLFLDIVFIDV